MEVTKDKQEILKFFKDKNYYGKRLIIIQAPPGTGKTFLAILCSKYLIENMYLKPYQKILVLTFSKNAKVQLEREVENIFSDKELISYLELTNFHAFFQKYVWAYRGFLGLPLTLELTCSQKRQLQIKNALSKIGIEINDKYIDGASSCLEYSCNNTFLPPNQLPKKYHRYIHLLVEEILKLNKKGYISYSDLAYYFRCLLNSAPYFLDNLRMKYPFLILDEYQDSSDLQDEIIRAILGESGKAIILADEMQIIHQWRGASLDRIKNIKKDFPYIKKELYEYPRYECDELSNIFIQLRNALKNKNFNYKIELSDDSIEILKCPLSNKVKENFKKLPPFRRERALNNYMAYAIINVLDKATKFNSCAILLTQNADVENFKKILREKNYYIKEISNGENLHNFIGLLLENLNDFKGIREKRIFLVKAMTYISLKKEIRSGLSWDMLLNELERNNRKVSGNKNDIRVDLEFLANKHDSFKDMIIKLTTIIKNRFNELVIDWDVFNLLCKISKSLKNRKDITPYEICNNLILQEQHILSHRKPKGIFVMNVHQAKGKEFDWVILPDVSEYAFDSRNEEKIRLFYVAITRAKKKVSFYDRENISRLSRLANIFRLKENKQDSEQLIFLKLLK